MTTLTPNSQQIAHPHLAAAHESAKTLAPNTVKVWPGGTVFTSIQAAINSIQNASPQLQYQVAIGSGTFTELVTLKDNVFMSGAGQDQTILTRPGTSVIAGTLMTGGNCGAGMMTVIATGGPAGTYCSALYLAVDGTFTGTGLTLTGTDSGNAGNIVTGITNMNGSDTTSLILSNCIINAQTQNSASTTYGIRLMAPSVTLNIQLSTVNAQGEGAVGILTANQAVATVEDCTVTGLNWSLQNYDNQSQITANSCTLTGPVSAGVIVNP